MADEQLPTPPTEDNQPAPAPVTLEDIKTLLGGVQEDFTRQLNGAMAKTRKEMQQQREALAAIATPPTPPQEETTQDNAPAALPAEGEDPISVLTAQMDRERRAREVQMDKERRAREKQINEMKQQLQQSQKEAQRLQAVNGFARAVGDRAIDPEAMLLLGEQRGLVKQNEGTFLILTGKDEYTGDPIWQDIETGADALIKQFPYLEKPRPGNGTGATNGETPIPQGEQSVEQLMQASLKAKNLL